MVGAVITRSVVGLRNHGAGGAHFRIAYDGVTAPRKQRDRGKLHSRVVFHGGAKEPLSHGAAANVPGADEKDVFHV